MTQEKKIKKQYNLEKQNEETIDMLIDQIAIHIDEETIFIDFMQKVREYRNRIYELKLQLGSYLTKAYQEKNTMKLQDLRERMDKVKEQKGHISITNFFGETEEGKNSMGFIIRRGMQTGEYPIQVLARKIPLTRRYGWEMRYVDSDNYTLLNWEERIIILQGFNDFAREMWEKDEIEKLINGLETGVEENNNNKKYYKDLERECIKNINVFNMNIVFNYYEKELKFWEEMNLNKIGEFTQEEQCLE